MMRQLGILTLVVTLFAAPAAAVVLVVRGLPVDLPGVTLLGNLDCVNTGEGVARITLNTNTGRFVMVARGRVPNASRKLQVFRSAASLETVLTCALEGFDLIDADDLDELDVDIRAFYYAVYKRGLAVGLAILHIEGGLPT